MPPNKLNKSPLIVLASRSPRRTELLKAGGYRFTVDPPDDSAESGVVENETPEELVVRFAKQKAQNVAMRRDRGLILAADTVAVCQGRVLGKPKDRAHAAQMLRSMSGRRHQVLTAICLWARPSDRFEVAVDSTTLVMDRLSEPLLERFLDSDGWVGKAGGFGYQDGLDWVHVIEGSESNVVGLPMERLEKMLAAFDNDSLK